MSVGAFTSALFQLHFSMFCRVSIMFALTFAVSCSSFRDYDDSKVKKDSIEDDSDLEKEILEDFDILENDDGIEIEEDAELSDQDDLNDDTAETCLDTCDSFGCECGEVCGAFCGTCNTGVCRDCLCVAESVCDTGLHDGGDGQCVAIGTCSSSFHDGGDGRCFPKGTCAPGFHDGGLGVCTPINQCDSGHHDGGSGVCVAEGTCSIGYILGGTGACEPACVPACENGGVCTAPDTCACALGWGGDRCQREVDVEMVRIPMSGTITTFAMGRPAHCWGGSQESPRHQVTLTPYYIDKYPVTASAYKACVVHGGCSRPATGDDATYDVSGKENHPVNHVFWEQADRYCRWVGGRLPTEAEWERAAKGESEACYPWGDDCPESWSPTYCSGEAWTTTTAKANCLDSGCNDGFEKTSPVDAFPLGVSADGVWDMTGNVWELTSDGWWRVYTTEPAFNPIQTITGSQVVRRGGAWDSNSILFSNSSVRKEWSIGSRSGVVGFRCARSRCPNGYHDGGDDVCLELGNCSAGFHDGGDGICVSDGTCRDGFQLDGSAVCVPVCQPQCMNGATCIGPNSCDCEFGWVGPTCEAPLACDPVSGDCAVPMDRIRIPAVGSSTTFTMGCPPSDGRCQLNNEQPAHQVTLSAYMIDRYPVTASAYAACIQAGACTTPKSGSTLGTVGLDNHPINNVDWHQATAYCAWTGGRLPTEAEWERAAKGVTHRRYPWGDDCPSPWHSTCSEEDWTLATARANCRDDSCKDAYPGTSPVDAFPLGVSSDGVWDMAGNVEEWTSDWAGRVYTTAPITNPTGPTSGSSTRVLRGGSFLEFGGALRATYRNSAAQTQRLQYIGFRCASDIP